jgi:transcriptional regulator with XRE-family HTH domain
MTSRRDAANVRFAERVARLQRAWGLSNMALAERSNMDQDELDAILGGEGEVGVDAVYLLAGALGVTPRDLLEGTDPERGGEDRAG